MRIYIYVIEVETRLGVHNFQTFKFSHHPFAEILPVFVCVLCPGRFGDSHCTWESLVVCTFWSLHIFSPNITLYSDDMLLSKLVSVVRNRVITICFLQGIVSANSSRSNFRLFLIVVQIYIRTRSHDGIMPCFGCVHTAFYTAPWHNSRIGSQTTFENFIPANDVFAFAIQVFLHTGNEIALQLIFFAVLYSVYLTGSCIIFQP